MAVKNEKRERAPLESRGKATEKQMKDAVGQIEESLGGRMRCLVVIAITEGGKGITLAEGSDSVIIEMLAQTAKNVIAGALEEKAKGKKK